MVVGLGFVLDLSTQLNVTTHWLTKRICSYGNSLLAKKCRDRRLGNNSLIDKSLYKSVNAVNQLEKLVGSWVNIWPAIVGVPVHPHAAIPCHLLTPPLYKQTFPFSALRHSVSRFTFLILLTAFLLPLTNFCRDLYLSNWLIFGFASLLGDKLIIFDIMANVLALTLALIVIAAGGSVGRVAAQSSSSCSATLVSLAPCLAFLQGGANNSSPTQGCCTGLASVVSTSAACLCQMVTTTNNPLGIPINQTQALALPGACKITTPPVSQCKSTSGDYLIIINWMDCYIQLLLVVCFTFCVSLSTWKRNINCKFNLFSCWWF